MEVINDHELVPERFLKQNEFILPDFSTSTIEGPTSSSTTPTPRDEPTIRGRGSLLPPPLPPNQKERGVKRRRPVDSPTDQLVENQSRSSRSSTPGSIKSGPIKRS